MGNIHTVGPNEALIVSGEHYNFKGKLFPIPAFFFFFLHQCYHRENLFLEGSFLNYEIACKANSLISQSLSISLTHSSIFRH